MTVLVTRRLNLTSPLWGACMTVLVTRRLNFTSPLWGGRSTVAAQQRRWSGWGARSLIEGTP